MTGVSVFLLDLALLMNLTTVLVFRLFDNSHAIIFLDYRSMTLVRYTKPVLFQT